MIRVSLSVGDMYDSKRVPVDQLMPGQLKSPPRIIFALGNCDLMCCRESLRLSNTEDGKCGGW